MNKYTINVANATIESKAYNEYGAIMTTGLFIGAEIIAYLGNYEGKDAWAYRVGLNGRKQIRYELSADRYAELV